MVTAARRMPKQKPGESKQDYGTPPELIKAVEARFGPLDVDLAARADNAVAGIFVPPEADSLRVDWGIFATENCWLNPEFARIEPWAAKCASADSVMREEGGSIFLLVPLASSANWWAKHVHRRATVLMLRGRVQFIGAPWSSPFSVALCIYGKYNTSPHEYELWEWRESSLSRAKEAQ